MIDLWLTRQSAVVKYTFVNITHNAILAQEVSVLKRHTNNCPSINHKRSVLLGEEGSCINLRNLKRLIKAPFIIYGDFECVITHSNDNTDFGPNTKKYQNHIFAAMATN